MKLENSSKYIICQVGLSLKGLGGRFSKKMFIMGNGNFSFALRDMSIEMFVCDYSSREIQKFLSGVIILAALLSFLT